MTTPWFPMEVKMHHNAKVVGAGNAAVGLWVRLTAWSNDELTDGYIPEAVARSMGTAKEIAACVNARRTPDGNGLLVPVDGGYRIHDYAEHCTAAAVVLERKEAKRLSRQEAGRLGGIASGEARRGSKQRSNDEANGEANREQIEAHLHLPTPDPTKVFSPPPDSSDRNVAVVVRSAAELLMEEARDVGNPPGWLVSVGQRLAAEHGEWVADQLDAGGDPSDIAVALFHRDRSAPDVPRGTSPADPIRSRLAGEGYGTAVACAQVDRDEVDREAFLAEVAVFDDPAFRDGAIAAYDATAFDANGPRLRLVQGELA